MLRYPPNVCKKIYIKMLNLIKNITLSNRGNIQSSLSNRNMKVGMVTESA